MNVHCQDPHMTVPVLPINTNIKMLMYELNPLLFTSDNYSFSPV